MKCWKLFAGVLALAALQHALHAQEKLPPAKKAAEQPKSYALPPADHQAHPAPLAVQHPTVLPGAGCGVDACCEPSCQSISVFADFLYLIPRGTSVPFGQVRDGVGALAVPRGSVGVVDPDASFGFRLGAQAQIDCNTLAVLTFSWLQSDHHDRLDVPAQQPFVIRSLVVHPNTINAAADSLSARARIDIDYYTLDADLKRSVCAGCNHDLFLIMGGRYAHLDQEFRSQFSILGATTVDTNINFDGGGFRFGGDGAYGLGKQTYVYGKAVANLLFGHFSADYRQNNIFGGEQARTNFGDNRLVPVLEAELGLGWRSCDNRVHFVAGYTASAWFNTLTTNAWIHGVQQTQFHTTGDNMRDTLTFDGLFVRAMFKF